MTVVARRMTAREFLSLPDDGVRRWLIDGDVREIRRGFRDRWSAACLTNVAVVFGSWIRTRPKPRGEILGGEVGVRLRDDPPRLICVDAAYLSPEVMARQDPADIVAEVPTLVIDIRAHDDTDAGVAERLAVYAKAGVPVVWEVRPREETVTIHRPGTAAEFLSGRMELVGGEELPGLRFAVSELFE